MPTLGPRIVIRAAGRAVAAQETFGNPVSQPLEASSSAGQV
jgi:hypothetical protein